MEREDWVVCVSLHLFPFVMYMFLFVSCFDMFLPFMFLGIDINSLNDPLVSFKIKCKSLFVK